MKRVTDLLTCPFCGGKARLVKKEGFGPAGGKFSRGYVRCDKCEITTPTKSPWEKAVVAWNRRATLSAGQAQPVAYQYRWKLDGEWTNWRVSDASQKSPNLKDLEERPLYALTVAESIAEAARIGDAVLSWMVKYDILDAGNEYRAEDVVAALNDIAPHAGPSAPDGMREALSLVIEYDDLLQHWEGPEQVLLAGDVEEIDAAYDKMVAACRAALGGKHE